MFSVFIFEIVLHITIYQFTMDTPAFGYILPATRQIPDLHWLEMCAARRTHIKIPPHP